MTGRRARTTHRWAAGGALLLGLGVLFLATFVGSAGLIDAIVTTPPIIRAGLAGASTVAALWLLARSIARMSSGGSDMSTMIRGVRLAFLAVAAFAAAVGWVVGHPLPLVVAAIIAAIDVAETSLFLLIADR
jgi:hypothetical protein